ncbi:AAA family ATPase, partial [Streptosporangium sp. NPDC023615]|uniref:AAA family ATPase n=1 Tax=Streptosporangium sp. NPDC023615 TaxID=3154794 RepID=UPI00343A8A8E
MYVSELRVSGVRGFSGRRDVDLRLTRPDGSHAGWTVLAGRNGSGKTTLLRALALAMAGPSVARGLMPSFDGWISEGLSEAVVAAEVVDGNMERWSGGRPGGRSFPALLTWSRETIDDPEDEEYEPQPILQGYGDAAFRGPWADNPRGWFLAGYGPFRRLVGGSADAQRLMLSTGPVSRLASLFHEDASLAESVSWLIDLHLRRLERRPGAEGLLLLVTDLLNDGLLPDGFQVVRVDSEGLWAKRDGRVIPLRELSDGYRTVTALVLDLVRQVGQMFPKELLSWTVARDDRLSTTTIDCDGLAWSHVECG